VTEVLFYHLDRLPLERVLPELLEKCLERQWNSVVQLGSDERCEALDAHLWTYRDESFLPHGSAQSSAGNTSDGSARAHPVWLTTSEENPNEAQVRFLADGADVEDFSEYQRIVRLFDGNDTDAVEHARAAWKTAKQAGHEVTYWQQNERGRWEKKG
jgi:DNA polymerase III subunit chi